MNCYWNRENFRYMEQKFPESPTSHTADPHPSLMLATISGEKSLNCELICISVHINELQTYEYSYFLLSN